MARAERAATERPGRQAGQQRADPAPVLARHGDQPLDLGLRTHEILENALEFQLTGHDDYGSGTTLATTAANITGTRELLAVLHPLLAARYPGLPAVYSGLDRLDRLVSETQRPDGSWTSVARLSAAQREQIDAAAGQILQELAPVASMTEPRQS